VLSAAVVDVVGSTIGPEFTDDEQLARAAAPMTTATTAEVSLRMTVS
jgi:hypothetical protein